MGTNVGKAAWKRQIVGKPGMPILEFWNVFLFFQ